MKKKEKTKRNEKKKKMKTLGKVETKKKTKRAISWGEGRRIITTT